MTHRRLVALLTVLATAVATVAGCGGSDQAASSSTDVATLLTDTFTGSKQVESGRLDLSVELAAQGGESQLDGPLSLRLSGPFKTQGGGRLPEFKLEAAFEGAGQSLQAGATSTGEKGYVSFQGTDYVLPDLVFQQFKAGFEEAQKQATDGEDAQSFASLGMDPREWLTDPKNAGEAKVGDADTIKITGGVDLERLLDDVDAALGKASALGLQGAGEVPEKLTAAQRRQVVESVKDPRVEIYTGVEDKILRRLVVSLGVADAASGTTGTVAFDVAITDLNEDQDIAEPADAKPFDELLGQLGGLGALGGTEPSQGDGSGADLGAYSECLTDAGEDLDKARECAELLTE